MIDQERKKFLSGQSNNDKDLVLSSNPFVPTIMEYTLPQPGFEIDNRVEQILEIPALPIIIDATNQLGEKLCDRKPPITNLQLNLSNYAELIGGILPPHTATAEGEEDVNNDQDQEQDEEEDI
jgi:hypothetical protein